MRPSDSRLAEIMEYARMISKSPDMCGRMVQCDSAWLADVLQELLELRAEATPVVLRGK